MKKFFAIGLITVSSLALLGCQQQQQQKANDKATQTESSKASIEITEGNKVTSKASLQVLPSTMETSGSSTEVKKEASSQTSLEVKKADSETSEKSN